MSLKYIINNNNSESTVTVNVHLHFTFFLLHVVSRVLCFCVTTTPAGCTTNFHYFHFFFWNFFFLFLRCLLSYRGKIIEMKEKFYFHVSTCMKWYLKWGVLSLSHSKCDWKFWRGNRLNKILVGSICFSFGDILRNFSLLRSSLMTYFDFLKAGEG